MLVAWWSCSHRVILLAPFEELRLGCPEDVVGIGFEVGDGRGERPGTWPSAIVMSFFCTALSLYQVFQ